MLRQTFARSARRPFSSSSNFGTTRSRTRGLAATSAVIVVSVLTYSSLNAKVIQNDSLPPSGSSKPAKLRNSSPNSPNSGDTLDTLVWGSNSAQRLVPDASDTESIRSPTPTPFFKNAALRDLSLHKDYAACIDARGDIYQWGKGTEPSLKLKGKNIVRLQLTDTKVYALSSSGKIYALDAQPSESGFPALSESPWWSTAPLWRSDESDTFQEIVPQSKLSWGEKFISISTGDDHLLALTSSGRAFAHPINSNANAYGQLGFRKFEVPKPSSKEHIPVELVPKSIADPYSKASPLKRRTFETEETKGQPKEQTQPISFPFCTAIFEIPSLKGITLTKLVAGGRASFALTSTNRVLGWGANEYGQVGLGDNVTLPTITVPTEVILWRMTSPRTQMKCVDVTAGGDVTCFTVEKTTQTEMSNSKTVELLLCGNGQYGSLGNNAYTNAQGSPIRARNVSNLTEYDDATQSLRPIAPHSVSVSPTGHVLLTLDSAGGRDLFSWGKNFDYELGNGKRSSVAVPTTLIAQDGERFILQRKKAKEVLDGQGYVWKRGVEVEQRAIAGYSSSAVFWKVST